MGVVEVLALSLSTKTLPPVPEILREKESQSLGIERESILKDLPKNHGTRQARVHHPQKHPTRKQSVNQHKKREIRMITYLDIFEVNSKKGGLSIYNKGLSPISLKDDSCWTEFFWMKNA